MQQAVTWVLPKDTLKPGLPDFFNRLLIPMIWSTYCVVKTTGQQVKTYSTKRTNVSNIKILPCHACFSHSYMIS